MKCFGLLITVLLFLFSCSPSAERKYLNLLEDYSSGEVSDPEPLHEALLKAYSLSSHSSDKIFFSKNIILLSDGDEPEIIYPASITLNADESIDKNISFGGINSNYILLGNNKGFCVFNTDGDPIAIYKAGPKEKIDAMAMRKDRVVFLSKTRLYEFNINSRQTGEFVNGNFSSSSKKYFRSFILSSTKYSAVITGIAGSYYISVYDTRSGEIKLKNVLSSSFDFSIKGEALYYLRGGAGNWSVAKYDIASKNRSQVRKISYLDDFFVAAGGFVTIADGKSVMESFTGEKEILPREWTVKGSCENLLLINYDDNIYPVDFDILMQRLKEISNAKEHASLQRSLFHG